jgi:hypothetical protein
VSCYYTNVRYPYSKNRTLSCMGSVGNVISLYITYLLTFNLLYYIYLYNSDTVTTDYQMLIFSALVAVFGS